MVGMRVSLIGILAAVGVAVLVYATNPFSGSETSADELLAMAANASVAPEPGQILKVSKEIYGRSHGQAEVFPPPAGERTYVHIPERILSEAWLLVADEEGTVSKRYLITRDETGNVIQEEYYDGEREFVYFALQNYVAVVKSEPPNANMRVDLETLLTNSTDVEYSGEADVNGRRVHLVKVRHPAPELAADANQRGYRGIYYGDLGAVSLVTEFALDTTTSFPIRRVMKAVDAGGHETVIHSNSVTAMTVLDQRDVPDDLFGLHHVSEDARYVESEPRSQEVDN